MFGKTAGCFSSLARELVTSSNQPMMLTKVNPVILRIPQTSSRRSANVSPSIDVKSHRPPPTSQKPPVAKASHPIQMSKLQTTKTATQSPALNNLNWLLKRKPQHQSSLCSSTPGRKAMTALTSDQSLAQVRSRSPVSGKAPNAQTVGKHLQKRKPGENHPSLERRTIGGGVPCLCQDRRQLGGSRLSILTARVD
jgi:hypothetical protein